MADKSAQAAFVDAKGRRRRTSSATEQTGIATACFELYGAGPETSPALFAIQLIVNANTYPFVVLEGSIGGDISRVPGTSWIVTSGSFGPYLSIDAKQVPLTNAPVDLEALSDVPWAQSLSISGDFQAPDSYAGLYGFDGATDEFIHTMLFKGWQACS
jgi:hypothetical protein